MLIVELPTSDREAKFPNPTILLPWRVANSRVDLRITALYNTIVAR